MPPKIGVISKTMVRVGGVFSPFIREFGETFYQFERPFGPFSPTPHEEAVGWFRKRRGG
jgi:hypothetical protein